LALTALALGGLTGQTKAPDYKTDKADPNKEVTCHTIPSAGQAQMSDTDCAFIASQINVLPSHSDPQLHKPEYTPSPVLKPGMDVPSTVKELKPLPQSVTQRLPALQGGQYFLSGQDIVVVGKGAKIAFVIDVRVRP
jgi:hypothetical protein